jgi:hypothetical protein
MNTETIFRSDMLAGGVQQARSAPGFSVLPMSSIKLLSLLLLHVIYSLLDH